MTIQKSDISKFNGYKAYLKDIKKINNLTIRDMTKIFGFKSQGSFYKVLYTNKHVSQKSACRISKILKLACSEDFYFKFLVVVQRSTILSYRQKIEVISDRKEKIWKKGEN
jgi:hypothetical protein